MARKRLSFVEKNRQLIVKNDKLLADIAKTVASANLELGKMPSYFTKDHYTSLATMRNVLRRTLYGWQQNSAGFDDTQDIVTKVIESTEDGLTLAERALSRAKTSDEISGCSHTIRDYAAHGMGIFEDMTASDKIRILPSDQDLGDFLDLFTVSLDAEFHRKYKKHHPLVQK